MATATEMAREIRRKRNAEYRARIQAMEKAIPETKRCPKCGETKSSDEFGRSSVSRDGLQGYCTPCAKIKEAERKPRNYSSYKERNRYFVQNFGITLEERDAMFDDQGKACKICGTTEARRYVVDHCHDSEADGKMVIRGILCDNCNRAIGLMGDDPERLIVAAEYLLAHKDILSMLEGGE